MATWAEFAEQEPDIAELGSRMLRKYGIAYLGTVRRDGGPRVHPVCPVIIDGRVYIGVIPSSSKRGDLERDGRFVLHALPGPKDAELSLNGHVRRLPSDEAAALADVSDGNVRVPADSVLYELVIDRVLWITYDHETSERPVASIFVWTGDD
ncbi:pyridoxamine 5'-phosphate oxidase family protein [Actinomadura rugatobispora]|uniref:Pyridoxamine 5'-phosphate oxidase family protein n=1 Tax=Actinomadura rugatobispora TaxID=1994 RepID=A0ABW0ZZW4_9ACTN|nr:hypothetical protein GCM10010200_042840 [Actinomadura rugatobispora]